MQSRGQSVPDSTISKGHFLPINPHKQKLAPSKHHRTNTHEKLTKVPHFHTKLSSQMFINTEISVPIKLKLKKMVLEGGSTNLSCAK